MQLLSVLAQLDHIVIAARISFRVRDGDRDVLPVLVGVRRSQTGQPVDELPYAAIERSRVHRLSSPWPWPGTLRVGRVLDHDDRGGIVLAAVGKCDTGNGARSRVYRRRGCRAHPRIVDVLDHDDRILVATAARIERDAGDGALR